MKDKLAGWLMNPRKIEKSTVLWNALASCLNSFQTMILLVVLTRLGNSTDSSIFVMAYAVGNLMMHIGKYGMRQFQVTDVREKYSYDEYVRSRRCSMALMAVLSILYVAWSALFRGYSAEKCAVVLLICLYKGIEAAEDVMHGRLQQQGRLDIAAKVLALRFMIFIGGYAVLYAVTRSLVLTTAVSVCLTGLLCVVLNRIVMPGYRDRTRTGEGGIPKRLLLDCLPLCLTMVTYMYLTNAPKYAVDGLVSDEAQTCFNIVFMPAFVVALLSNFIFNPVLKKMGELWNDGQIAALKRMALKLTAVPVAIDAAVVAAGYFLGPPVLSLIYGVDIRPYTGELVVFLLASGVTALLNLYVALITTMRKQRHLLISYAAGSLAMVLSGRAVLRAGGLQMLCWLYFAVLTGVLVYCMAVFAKTVSERLKQG